MARKILLPSWESEPAWQGVLGRINIEFMPDAWKPQLEQTSDLSRIPSFAYPTPFAWATMMGAIIREGQFSHLLFELYRNLVLGLSLGLLRLESVDLKTFEFGRVLDKLDEGYRYFGLLRDHTGRIFGGTSPDCLFWPSPRRSAEDWKQLKELIERHERFNDGYQLLADLREFLRAANLWKREEVLWMKGLDQIVGEERQGSKDNRHFLAHCLLKGPIQVGLPDKKRGALYWPILDKDITSRFLKALTGTFQEEKGAIGIYDENGIKFYEILMPVVPPGGDLLLSGAGNIRVLDEPSKIPRFTGEKLRLHDDSRGKGLFSLLQSLYRLIGTDMKQIKDQPFRYPDIVRILVARLGDAGIPGAYVSLSDRSYTLAFQPDVLGLPLATDFSGAAGQDWGMVVPYTIQNSSRRAMYLESHQGMAINDLKMLGFVLWHFFRGEAEVRDQTIVDWNLTPLLQVSREDGWPLYPRPDIYDKVAQERTQHRRLASLQRFVKAYKSRIETPDAKDVDRLLARAALAFAEWVWEEKILPSGHPPHRWESVQIGPLSCQLARDE